MTVKAQKPIVIFRGDNTAAFDLRTITILLTGDLDLSHATAKFTLLDFSKAWTEQEVATGELSVVFTAEQTKAFALGPQTGTLRLYDMSTGTPRQLTVVNKIPFFITNRVCEIDSQIYEADVCVSGGDVIHIEFNVGAGAVEGKADKVKNATAGDLASLMVDGNLEDSGIPKNDVLRKSQMDSTPALGSLNPVTSDGIKQAIDAATPSDYTQVKAQVEQNTGDIADIKEVIPNQASAQNKLADKAFVNSSIATNTATFRGSYNLVSDLGLTVSATEQQVAAAIAAKLASLVPPVVPENNDYCFVQVPKTDADPTVIVRVDRYKCTVTESGGVTTRVWDYEWSLNNSSFTAEQWAAINSGITSGLVEKLNGIEAGAQVNTVTGVKGDAEQNYRTGNINLTPANIGALGNTGDQTLSGDLTLDDGGAEKTLWFTSATSKLGIAISGGFDDRNQTLWNWPSIGLTGDKVLALLSDMYAAVQQIAPEWSKPASGQTGTTYTKDISLCTYNGVLYQCAKTYTTGSNSQTPPNDIYDISNPNNHWVVKKVSELFLPLTGGEINGDLLVGGRVDITAFFSIQSQLSSGLVFTGRINNIYRRAILPLANASDSLISTIAFLQNLAPNYDATSAYELNNLCTYTGKLYRCTTAITTAEAWTAAHWTEATVEDVLAIIRSTLDAKAPLASPAFTGTPTAPTPTAGDNSTKVATTAFVQAAVAGVPLRYSMPTAVALVAESDEATLVCADRAVTNATIAAGFSTLNLTFPTAVTDKVRDFYLRIVVAAGESAPALSIPQGITIENPDGAVPEIADGETSAASTTLVWFSETAPNIFTAKAETVKAVA